jgi:hypothetical protein
MDSQDVALWKDALISYSGEKFDELGRYLERISSYLFQIV